MGGDGDPFMAFGGGMPFVGRGGPQFVFGDDDDDEDEEDGDQTGPVIEEVGDDDAD